MELFRSSFVLVGMGPLLLAALLGAAPARAASPSARAHLSKAAEVRRRRRHDFEAQLRAEREGFQRQQRQERKAFRETLRGRGAADKKARLSEFNAQQKEKLKAFREGQKVRRREFEDGLKRHGAVAQPGR